MCLDKITKRYKSNEYKRGFGWKVFRQGITGGLYPKWKGKDKILSKEEFLNEKNFRGGFYTGKKGIEDFSYYPPLKYIKSNFGWHIYLERPSFDRLWTIVKVEYKGGHTRGIDGGKKVIVAKWMKIMEGS